MSPNVCFVASQETWYYMPVGHKIRQDNIVSSSMQLSGKVACDNEMAKAIVAEGPLANGAMPSVEVASENGHKKLGELFGAEAKAKAVPKRRAKAKGEEESVEVTPKTMPEFSPQFTPSYQQWHSHSSNYLTMVRFQSKSSKFD